jgi:hypothetical protein
MEIESVGVPVLEQPLYNVIRPVNDLWLWWALASTVGYLVSVIPSKLLGNSFAGIVASVLAFAVSMVLQIWVFNRYLSNFNGKQWVVVTIVGLLIAIIAAIIFLIPAFLVVKLLALGSFLSSLVRLMPSAVIFGAVVALAQWRVLQHYARGQGRGLWIVANIISAAISALSSTTLQQLTDNAYLVITGEIVTSALTAVIVGYTLMQVLRPYAPATT